MLPQLNKASGAWLIPLKTPHLTISCHWLDGQHTVFGKVFEGMDVVKTMETYGTQHGDPKAKTSIINIEVL